MDEEYKTMTPAIAERVEWLVDQGLLDLVPRGNLNNFRNLTPKLLDHYFQNSDGDFSYGDFSYGGMEYNIYETNRVPNHHVIAHTAHWGKSYDRGYHSSGTFERFYKAIVGYNDPKLMKDLGEFEGFVYQAMEVDKEWYQTIYQVSLIEALKRILDSYFPIKGKPKMKKAKLGGEEPAGKSLVHRIIAETYLEPEAVDLIINRCDIETAKALYRVQFLTHEQIEGLGISLHAAWHYYPLKNPTAYEPSWTNIGDADMIGPNMREAWAIDMTRSKKERVIEALVYRGPEKILPLLIVGDKEDVRAMIEARMKGDKKIIWNVIYKYGGRYT